MITNLFSDKTTKFIITQGVMCSILFYNNDEKLLDINYLSKFCRVLMKQQG